MLFFFFATTTHCLLFLVTVHGFYLALIALLYKAPFRRISAFTNASPTPRTITRRDELLMSSGHLEPQIITRPALGPLRAGLPEAKGYATAGRAPSPWVCQMRALPSLWSFIPVRVWFPNLLISYRPFVANQKGTWWSAEQGIGWKGLVGMCFFPSVWPAP
jgi:hypothetical protein